MEGAFTSGDPEAAWNSSQELLKAAAALMVEASRARFKVNFGSEICTHCSGLRAGPDVVATCFQLQQCYYSNRTIDLNPKQIKLVDALLKKTP